MLHIVIEKPGSYNQLIVKEAPDPTPKSGEVLVRSAAAGVNFADCMVRMGLYQSAKEFVGWPITPGFEFAGTVEALGSGSRQFKIGQKVFGVTLFGAYASKICVKEDLLFPLPDFLSLEQAAAMPSVFLTAWYALFELAHPHNGDTVLVHSAAGGVGSTLVQFAKIAGCKVAGVVGSSHKVDYVRSLGADIVIDKSKENLWREAEKFSPKGYEVILDANGVETLKESYNHLSLGGKLVVYGFHTMLTKGSGRPNWFKLIWNYLRTPRFNPLWMTSQNRSVLAFNLSYLFAKKDLLKKAVSTMLKWIEEGKVKPPKCTAYPIDQVAKAQSDLESGKTEGKLVLEFLEHK